MSLKKHFYRTEPFHFCTGLYSFKGKATRCIFFCYHKDKGGMYSCNALGFRFKNATVNGTCCREGIKILYDKELLLYEKKHHSNFCFYRLFGVIVFVLVYIGAPLAKIFAGKLWQLLEWFSS